MCLDRDTILIFFGVEIKTFLHHHHQQHQGAYFVSKMQKISVSITQKREVCTKDAFGNVLTSILINEILTSQLKFLFIHFTFFKWNLILLKHSNRRL